MSNADHLSLEGISALGGGSSRSAPTGKESQGTTSSDDEDTPAPSADTPPPPPPPPLPLPNGTLPKHQSQETRGEITAPLGDNDTRQPTHNGIPSKNPSPSNTNRRSIFTHYKNGSAASDSDPNEGLDAQMDSTESSASTSASATEVDIRYFAPPLDQKDTLRKRFALLDEIPLDDISKSQELPPVPSPLLRYVSDGSAPSGGVYPLVEPKSILREGKFSPTPGHLHDSSPSNDGTDDEANKKMAAQAVHWSSMSSLSTPRSNRMSDFKKLACEMDLEETKRFFRGSDSDHDPVVKFDPRIVITEYPDEIKRDWFAEEELNKFRRETAMLAAHYMMLHPEVAEEFNATTIDPVTGKPRRKALFSMPGLCSADGEDSLGGSAQIQKLLRNTVRAVLVVDPNKSILDLFERSIHEMFPTAKITGVQSSEEALRLYTTELGRKHWDGSIGGFDIIVVEEKLLRIRSKAASTKGGGLGLRHSSRVLRNRSDSLAQRSSSAQLRPYFMQSMGIRKEDSLSNIESLPNSPYAGRRSDMSGSQLIQKIRQLEEKYYSSSQETGSSNSNSNSNIEVEEVSLLSPLQRRSFFIGVSMNTEIDGETLRESGADLVWSKPPPKMDDTLRNQLISSLIAKRQKASFCISFPTSSASLEH